jgi:hypothetical protein
MEICVLEPWTTVVGDCEQDPSRWINTAGIDWVKITFDVSAKGNTNLGISVETSDDPGFGWRECGLVSGTGITTVVLSKRGLGQSSPPQNPVVPLQQWVRWRNKVANSGVPAVTDLVSFKAILVCPGEGGCES